MAISIVPATGKTGSYSYGNASLCIDNWEADGDQDVVDVSNMCSGNYKEITIIRKSGRFMVEGVWDLSRNPFAAFLKLGNAGLLVLRINNALFASIPNAVVVHWRIVDPAASVVRYQVILQSDGEFNDFSNTPA